MHQTLTLATVLLAACGGTVGMAGETDSGTDPTVDTMTDTMTDPMADSADDPPLVDAAVDTTPDPAVDITPDTGTDTAPPPLASVGDACTDYIDCVPISDGFCLTELPMGPGMVLEMPGGYCTQECSGEGDCEAGSGCIRDPMSGEGICFALCDSESDCRDGYDCASLPGPFPDPETYCLPPFD